MWLVFCLFYAKSSGLTGYFFHFIIDIGTIMVSDWFTEDVKKGMCMPFVSVFFAFIRYVEAGKQCGRRGKNL